MVMAQFVCTNWTFDPSACARAGKYSCKGCFLVLYCSSACQRSHWPRHRLDCKNPLGKSEWQPAWVVENRRPTFTQPGIHEHFGANKYLWGNVPALDIIQLESNEGQDYNGELKLLLTASGDLRNVVKTIADLPQTYKGTLKLIINDHDVDIVARNLILLLISLVAENNEEAVDCMIHFWYSALLRPSHLDLLQSNIRPLLQEVCAKIRSNEPNSLLGKTWTFGRRSLRATLTKAIWDKLLSYLDVPLGMTAERARQVRTAVTLAEIRQDYRDRMLCCQPITHRVPFSLFRRDGLLLPFGHPREDFNLPNPTFFQKADIWPMSDISDPLYGWSSKEVARTSSGPATADIYGKLFYYLRGVFGTFLERLASLDVSFHLFQVDARDIANHLGHERFSRIETSNISDGAYLGIHETLATFMPMLQSPLVNESSTLITLLMNVVDENFTYEDKLSRMTPTSPARKRLMRYCRPDRAPISTYDQSIVKFICAGDIVATYDDIFDRYVKNFQLAEFAQVLGGTMKVKHTIIEKWPYRLKLRPGQPGAHEEFESLLAGGVSSKERYIEWKQGSPTYG